MTDAVRDPGLVEHLLVLRAQLGDRDAFTDLHERYHSRLLYYLRRLDASPDAEDILQEVWITVVRKVATLKQPEAFKAWIYRIAHNRALSKMRRTRKHIALQDLPEEADLDEPSLQIDADGFQGLLDSLDAATIHQALERLSIPHREVLTLRFIEDLSYEEIAQVLDCRLGTVRSRIYYAKKALREQWTLLDSNPSSRTDSSSRTKARESS